MVGEQETETVTEASIRDEKKEDGRMGQRIKSMLEGGKDEGEGRER
jgi:hypothetical protein